MSIELTIPALGESISEATLAKWLKQVGDSVAVDEAVAELETDKITVSLPAPQAGVLTAQHVPAGSVIRIGASIGTLSTEARSVETSKPTQTVAPQVAQPTPTKTSQPSSTIAVPKLPQSSEAVPFTSERTASASGPALPPSKRQALREQGLPSTTGPGHLPSVPTAAVSKDESSNLATKSSLLREEIVPMSPLRKRIAERLVEAQHTAAILTTFNEVDMTNVMALRVKYQDEFTKKYGIKLGFMSFFAKACVQALKAFPGVNAELRGTEIVYKKYYDFGIAVGSGKGLVVPVVRNVDQLSFAQIEKTIADLAQKAKDNKLSLDDLAGGTFSITNGGIYGSMMSTPLLNLPQTGILGMHNIIRRPIGIDDQVQIRPMMYLALSYDHRVVDGREAVQCLVQIKEHVENPDKLLLEI